MDKNMITRDIGFLPTQRTLIVNAVVLDGSFVLLLR
jgi:hypothetical protein